VVLGGRDGDEGRDRDGRSESALRRDGREPTENCAARVEVDADLLERLPDGGRRKARVFRLGATARKREVP
jgi:hypothetical protein